MTATWTIQFQDNDRHQWSLDTSVTPVAAKQFLREAFEANRFGIREAGGEFVVTYKNIDLDTVTVVDLDGSRTRVTCQNHLPGADYPLGSSAGRMVQSARAYAACLREAGCMTEREFADFMLNLRMAFEGQASA